MKRRNWIKSILGGAPVAAAASLTREAKAEPPTQDDVFVHLPWEPPDLPKFPEPPVEGSYATGFGWWSQDVSGDEQASVRVDALTLTIRLSRHTRVCSIHRACADAAEDDLMMDLPTHRITPSMIALNPGWRIEPHEFAVGAVQGAWKCFPIIVSGTETAIRYSIDDGSPKTLAYRGTQWVQLRVRDGASVKFWTDTPLPSAFQAKAGTGCATYVIALAWHRPLEDMHPRGIVPHIVGRFDEFLGPRLRGELRRWHGAL